MSRIIIRTWIRTIVISWRIRTSAIIIIRESAHLQGRASGRGREWASSQLPSRITRRRRKLSRGRNPRRFCFICVFLLFSLQRRGLFSRSVLIAFFVLLCWLFVYLVALFYFYDKWMVIYSRQHGSILKDILIIIIVTILILNHSSFFSGGKTKNFCSGSYAHGKRRDLERTGNKG